MKQYIFDSCVPEEVPGGDWCRWSDAMEVISGLRKTISEVLTKHARTVTQIGADPGALDEYMDRMDALETENAKLREALEGK